METQFISPNINLDGDDRFVQVTEPVNYNVKNPLARLMGVMEEACFFAEELSCYEADSLQFLFPFDDLVIYGPSGSDQTNLNPQTQDNKTDFQKQNIKDFILTDTTLVRGWVNISGQVRPFLKVSYRGGPDSLLAGLANQQMEDHIFLYIKVQDNATPSLVKVPYNNETDNYEVEFWGFPDGGELFPHLSDKGKSSLQNGFLQLRNDLIRGIKNDFDREGLDDKNMYQVSPDNIMHPIRTLKIELAWSDHTQQFWDSLNGANYHYQFNMILRGWDNFMQVGVSGNPHGGFGFLHYRNLVSNYKPYSVASELARDVMPWMFDAQGHKGEFKEEKALSVDYMDLHILKPDCGIGIHRHRDNQEIFFLVSGKAFMMVGDWYKFPDRERAFEIRTLMPGSFSLLKAGQLHSLINALDVDATLLMFGGYD